MCVLAFAWRANPRWPLLLIGNRDERHERPTAPLGLWEGESIVAGCDLLSGGTWLGVSERGLAVVTNYSIGRIATGPTRGGLVPDFLRGRTSQGMAEMNPFNLLTFGADGAQFVSNYPENVALRLEPGIHALANAELDQRIFRADALRAPLAAWLEGDDAIESLLTPLGGGPAPEGAVPVFIRDPVYGTRCSTVVAVDASGRGRVVERSFRADGSVSGEVGFVFDWPFPIG